MENHIKALFDYREPRRKEGEAWVPKAADTVALAFLRAEVYARVYPCLGQGNIHALGGRMATVRFFCLTPEGETYLLKSFCEDPMLALAYFARKTGACFVMTARAEVRWRKADRDQSEGGAGDAAISFPVMDLEREDAFDHIAFMVDRVVEDAVALAVKECADGGGYLEACRAHFGWGYWGKSFSAGRTCH